MVSKFGPALARRVETARPHDRLEVQIYLKREPATAWDTQTVRDKASDRGEVVRVAKEVAEQSQQHFLTEVALAAGQGEFRVLGRHWINNSLGAEISPDILLRIIERPDVERVELVARARLEDLLHGPAEPLPSGQPVLASGVAWQVRYVNAPLLWDLGLRGDGVVVAVVDSGIQFDHPDLRNRLWDGGPEFPLHGYDFDAPDRDPRDERGHGTACAGLIAGDGSSGLNTGVAPEATLMALRIGGREPQSWSAFQFAIDHGADIVSMSAGWGAHLNPSREGWRVACELLLSASLVHLCSAGNDGDLGYRDDNPFRPPRNIPVPAACPPPWLHPTQTPAGRSSAIACGETDNCDVRVRASGRGPGDWDALPFTDYPYQNGEFQGLLKPDLCAPGAGSETCNWRFGVVPHALPYLHFGGTSAAAALMAGCAALLVQAAKRSEQPVLPTRIQQALEESAVLLEGQTTKRNDLGSGRVDVFQAYRIGLSRGWWK